MINKMIQSLVSRMQLLLAKVKRLAGKFTKRYHLATEYIGRYWDRLSRFQGNLVVGIVIAVALHLGHSSSWITTAEDVAMDRMNLLQIDTENLAVSKSEAGTKGYTFIDMDEKAYSLWDEPYHVPRDKLVQLIRYASEGGASAIIIDVDFSKKGLDPTADQQLQSYLSNYPDDAPSLILMRTFAPGKHANNELQAIRKAWFDADITSTSIHWAQPRFELDGRDRKVRRWRLVDAGCMDGKTAWLPSPQLLVALLTANGGVTWPEIAGKLQAAVPTSCDQQPDLSVMDFGPIEVAGHRINLFEQGSSQRVIYTFSDRLPFGSDALGYMRIPATLISESKSTPASDPVKGRVVIIGTSYHAAHDIHSTPVGDMPGALIILNAANSLARFGQLQEIWFPAKLLISALVILLAAYLFSRFRSDVASHMTALAVILFLVPVSFYFFRYGVWVDTAAPVLGMQLLRMWGDSRKVHKIMKDHGSQYDV